MRRVRSTKAVLIVDDEALHSSSLENQLRIAGLKVSVVGNAGEALAVLDKDERSVGLVITDMKMPVGSKPPEGFNPITTGGGHQTGAVLAHEIKTRWPQLPVAIHSAFMPKGPTERWCKDNDVAFFVKSDEASLVGYVLHLYGLERGRASIKKLGAYMAAGIALASGLAGIATFLTGTSSLRDILRLLGF
jgi:CheY-like chemotaxis protein